MSATLRTNAGALAALAALAAAAWLALALGFGEDAMMEAPLFVAGWGVMMAAMMTPSATPLVLLYRAPGRGLLVAAYLVVWLAIGIPVYLLARAFDVMELPAGAIAAVLAAAGVYQLTPLKDACLSRCRAPSAFLVERWGRNPARLGVEYAGVCVGCCWALMAVLVVAGAMAFAWAAAIALVVFAEKVLPGGQAVARLAGLSLLAAAGVVLLTG